MASTGLRVASVFKNNVFSPNLSVFLRNPQSNSPLLVKYQAFSSTVQKIGEFYY